MPSRARWPVCARHTRTASCPSGTLLSPPFPSRRVSTKRFSLCLCANAFPTLYCTRRSPLRSLHRSLRPFFPNVVTSLSFAASVMFSKGRGRVGGQDSAVSLLAAISPTLASFSRSCPYMFSTLTRFPSSLRLPLYPNSSCRSRKRFRLPDAMSFCFCSCRLSACFSQFPAIVCFFSPFISSSFLYIYPLLCSRS